MAVVVNEEVTKAAALSLPTGRKFETFGVVQGPTMGDCLNVFDRLMNLDCVDIIAVPKYIAEYSYGGFGRRDFVNRVTARYGHDCKVMHLLGLKYGLWELAGMDDSSVMSMDTSYFVMQATEHVNVMETRRAGWEANLEKADTTFEELYNRFQYIDRIKDSILQRRV
jgi:hypothetical protein